jgi:hypothetical protein
VSVLHAKKNRVFFCLNPIFRFLFKSLFVICLITGLVIGYGTFCDFFFSQIDYLDFSEKKQWILAQQGGSYDYAVLGSSRAFGAFDMNLLDSLTGMDGINLGSNGSGFKDNYLILSIFLRSNKIRKLFLQVDMASLNSKAFFSNEFHAFTFMPYWEFEEVREVLKKEISLLGAPISSLTPQWRYFYFNKYFSPKEVLRKIQLSKVNRDLYTDTKGGMLWEETAPKKEGIKIFQLPQTANPEDWSYLMKIKSKAEDHGIVVVFFTAPRYQDQQRELRNILTSLPNRKIFPDGFNYSDQELFYDQGHLNQLGKKKFTNQFGQNCISEFVYLSPQDFPGNEP